MAPVEKHAQKVNLWTALAQRGWAFASAVGFDGWISAAVLAVSSGAWGLAVWVYDHLPFWAASLLALVLGSATVRLYAELHRAWAVRGLKTLDLKSLGRDCQRFREDVFEFLVARVDTAPGRMSSRRMLPGDGGNLESSYADWARTVDYSSQTRARAAQKFAHRAVALCHLMKNSGISPPNLWAFDHELENITAHIGVIGELLERGLLKEARGFSPETMRDVRLYLR